MDSLPEKMIKNRWIDGRYLKADGTMAVNTWVGEYVGANGYVTDPPEDKKEARLSLWEIPEP